MIKKATTERGLSKDIHIVASPDVSTLSRDVRFQTISMYEQFDNDLSDIVAERIFVNSFKAIAEVDKARRHVFRERLLPAASYIIAPPVDGSAVSTFAHGVSGVRTIEAFGGDLFNQGRVLTYDGSKKIIIANIAGVKDNQVLDGLVNQMKHAFGTVEQMVSSKGFDISHDLVRTWFSLTDISEKRPDERTNYVDFNELCRAPWLDKLGYKGRYFSSTGVNNGHYSDGRMFEFMVIAYDHNDVGFIKMDNPLQTPVYRYMEGGNTDQEKSCVCFERGMQVTTPTVVEHYVAGTSHLLKNKEIIDDARGATDMTLNNINFLLKRYNSRGLPDTKAAVTYIKPEEEVGAVMDVMDEKGIGVNQKPHLIVFNSLCYRPLIMETELIATTPKKKYDARLINA
jgi:hypothetical protein